MRRFPRAMAPGAMAKTQAIGSFSGRRGACFGPATLEAHRVAEEAEAAVLSAPLAREDAFGAFYSYLAVDEPAVHLMPLHFLPAGLDRPVGDDLLLQLGVAAKLEYARNRWLDQLVDGDGAVGSVLAAHRLNDAVLALIRARYARVVEGTAAAPFFAVLADLHARHGLSLILDGGPVPYRARSIALEDYVTHATARHGPFRASLDALLLSVGASEHELREARSCWHDWALGVQFYDDALDAEEDYRDGNLSWVTSRTLERLSEGTDRRAEGDLPEANAFYEAALTRGVIREALTRAESFFTGSARRAAPAFPSWAKFQRTCSERTRELREDFDALVVESGGA